VEQRIQKQILNMLNAIQGVRAIKAPVGPMLVGSGSGRRIPNPMAGFPDIMGWLPDGTPFYIEVKTLTGQVSKKQREWAQFFSSKSKCIYILARSVDDVIRLLIPQSEPPPEPPGAA
jgi:hypothetical protein